MKNKKMKLARVACDLSQEQLAEKIGPTIKLCILICKALNTTLDQLFWDNDLTIVSNSQGTA